MPGSRVGRVSLQSGGDSLCARTSCPPVPPGIGPLAQRRAEAAAHPGLCGVHHAAFLIGASFADGLARGKGVAITKGFWNQVKR